MVCLLFQHRLSSLSCFADDIDSLSPEDNRARSPSPPPLQPYDECPPLLNHLPDTAPTLAYSPPNSSQSLGPPPLTLMEVDGSTVDWQQTNHVSEGFQSHSPKSPLPLNNIKTLSELPLSKSELAEIKSHNLNVRSLAYREVRRPGISKY